MSATGEAAGEDTLASWITRLEQVKGWVNPWITSYTADGTANEGTETKFIYNSGVDLTADALTKRGREGLAAEADAAATGVVAP